MCLIVCEATIMLLTLMILFFSFKMSMIFFLICTQVLQPFDTICYIVMLETSSRLWYFHALCLCWFGFLAFYLLVVLKVISNCWAQKTREEKDPPVKYTTTDKHITVDKGNCCPFLVPSLHSSSLSLLPTHPQDSLRSLSRIPRPTTEMLRRRRKGHDMGLLPSYRDVSR